MRSERVSNLTKIFVGVNRLSCHPVLFTSRSRHADWILLDRANYQPKEPKKPALIHQVSDDAEGVRYIVARAPSGSSPSYRIAILEELLKKPHSPIDPRDPGMTVSCGIWQKISSEPSS
jgi:hypothetical protein